MSKKIHFKKLHGSEIKDFIVDIANLRITIFREYPYLYQGDLEYEKFYLSRYANAKGSMIALALCDGKVIGATTCIPLIEEDESFKAPLLESGLSLNSSFYFGESIILPEYRGLGIGLQFFELREKHAKEYYSDLSFTCFCSVVRGDHPLRPKNYKGLKNFWERLGYMEYTNINIMYPWKDIDKSEGDLKQMNYWIKKWK